MKQNNKEKSLRDMEIQDNFRRRILIYIFKDLKSRSVEFLNR